MKKNSKKALIVGLTATAAIAAVAAVMAYEEDTIDKIEGYLKRQRVKHFIKSKFSGNNKVMQAIETLTEKEIDMLLNVIEKTGSWKDSAVDAFSDLQDKASDIKDTVEDKLTK